MFIYKATNLVNGKSYIGQTTRSLAIRKKEHKFCRKNRDSTYFYNAIKKYGIDNFQWEIIENCDSQEELDEMEFHYIKQYGSFYKENGYNLCMGGFGGCNGYEFTEEQKEKVSEALKGRVFTEEHKKKLSEKRIYLFSIGELEPHKPLPNAEGENNPMFGKKHNEESKRKMTLPTNTDDVKANVKDGVLEVTFYEKEGQQGNKQIPINSE